MKTLLAVATLLTISLSSHAQTLHDQLIDRWSMETVMLGADDVSKDHNPKNERWIEFHQDGKYFSDGAPNEADQGHWSVDENTRTLKLVSDVENEESSWLVWFEKGSMNLRGIGDRKTERMIISYSSANLAP